MQVSHVFQKMTESGSFVSVKVHFKLDDNFVHKCTSTVPIDGAQGIIYIIFKESDPHHVYVGQHTSKDGEVILKALKCRWETHMQSLKKSNPELCDRKLRSAIRGSSDGDTWVFRAYDVGIPPGPMVREREDMWIRDKQTCLTGYNSRNEVARNEDTKLPIKRRADIEAYASVVNYVPPVRASGTIADMFKKVTRVVRNATFGPVQPEELPTEEPSHEGAPADDMSCEEFIDDAPAVSMDEGIWSSGVEEVSVTAACESAPPAVNVPEPSPEPSPAPPPAQPPALALPPTASGWAKQAASLGRIVSLGDHTRTARSHGYVVNHGYEVDFRHRAGGPLYRGRIEVEDGVAQFIITLDGCELVRASSSSKAVKTVFAPESLSGPLMFGYAKDVGFACAALDALNA